MGQPLAVGMAAGQLSLAALVVAARVRASLAALQLEMRTSGPAAVRRCAHSQVAV